MKKRHRLRVLRAEHQLSQMAVASKMRVGTHRYWQIENGYAEPTAEERAAIAKVFKLAEVDVFPDTEARAS